MIKILPALNLFPQSSSLKKEEENEIKEVIPSSSGGYRRHSASLGSLMRCYALFSRKRRQPPTEENPRALVCVTSQGRSGPPGKTPYLDVSDGFSSPKFFS